MTEKLLLSWSSGKDSAWALHRLRTDERFDVMGLLTTMNEVAGRVAMHAVRGRLLEAQVERMRLPLWKIPLPSSDEEYERWMADAMGRALEAGIEAVAFGDLFLEDVRR